MKNSFWLLVRTDLQMMWGRAKYNKKRKKNIPLKLIAIVGGIAFIAVMAINAVVFTLQYHAMGTPESALLFSIAQGMIITILIGVTRGGTSNTSSDANFLLSLPLKRNTILLSKSIARYLVDLLFVACVVLPGIVVHQIIVEFSIEMLLRCLLVMFLIPLLSVALNYIISFGVFKISNRMRRPEMLRTILMLIVLMGFMYFYMRFSFSMGMGSDLSGMMSEIKILAWGPTFAAFGGLANIGKFLLVTVLPFALGNWLQAAIYGISQTRWRSRKKDLTFVQTSPARALFGKEMRFYFSIPIYVVNTISGPFMALLAAVALLVMRSRVYELINNELEFAGLSGMMPIVLLTVFLFFPAMTLITACSISLEGKNIRILRSSPISEMEVFWSKINVQLVLCMPAFLLCTAAGCFALDISFVDSLLILILVALMTIFVAMWGLYVNLLLPRLDWVNEIQVIKQSMAILVTIFSNFIPMLLPLLLIYLTKQNFTATCLLTGVCFLVLIGIVLLLLNTSGRRRYRDL